MAAVDRPYSLRSCQGLPLRQWNVLEADASLPVELITLTRTVMFWPGMHAPDTLVRSSQKPAPGVHRMLIGAMPPTKLTEHSKRPRRSEKQPKDVMTGGSPATRTDAAWAPAETCCPSGVAAAGTAVASANPTAVANTAFQLDMFPYPQAKVMIVRLTGSTLPKPSGVSIE